MQRLDEMLVATTQRTFVLLKLRARGLVVSKKTYTTKQLVRWTSRNLALKSKLVVYQEMPVMSRPP